MSIEIDGEPLITFNEAAPYLPTNCRPSLSTWWRWWRKGLKGRKLKTVCVGGKRYTTPTFIREWIAEVTQAAAEPTGSAPDRTPIRTPTLSALPPAPLGKGHKAAEEELNRAGI